MVVTRQKNKKWRVDISDGYNAVTEKQILNLGKKLKGMKLTIASINFIKLATRIKSQFPICIPWYRKKMNCVAIREGQSIAKSPTTVFTCQGTLRMLI